MIYPLFQPDDYYLIIVYTKNNHKEQSRKLKSILNLNKNYNLDFISLSIVPRIQKIEII